MTATTNLADSLRPLFGGTLLADGHPAYDEAREVYNSMIDSRPGVIARCESPGDVAAAIAVAREAGVPLAVRAGGHSVAGDSTVDGGVVIDVRPLKSIAVDPDRRVATVGAGCTWAEFDRAAQAHGLATTGGRVSTTGVAGLTLGGGSGWLERSHGLACDNLIGAELVTADGRFVSVSEEEQPELMWALRGGGGNFGVVTSLTFRLRPVGPEVLAGLLLYPGERGPEVLRFLREFMETAPDELGPALLYLTGPPEEGIPEELHGKLVAAIGFVHSGPVEEAERDVAALRAFGPPAADLVERVPYADFQCSIDDPPGYRNYWTAEYLSDLPDAAIDTLQESALRMKPGPAQLLVVPWGGAVARAAGESTPLAKRDAAWVVHPFALWEDAADDEFWKSWGRAAREAMKPYATGGVYLNFIGDEGHDRVRAGFGDAYDRLAAVKAEWDPENVFNRNHNILPAGAETVAREGAAA